mmetsp:Transcript_11163/g.29053  ORF Transcript_11163/g.29053 Transcript_11163/m.29053 type:complete len:270 (-) Transcript_11163:20-829(-)
MALQKEGGLLAQAPLSDAGSQQFSARFFPAKTAAEHAHYEIHGGADQYVYVELKEGDKIVTTPGSMLFMGPTLEMGVDYGSCCTRLCSGEGCCLTTFTPVSADGTRPSYIAVTPYAPAIVVPLDLERVGVVHVKSGAFFAGLNDVNIDFTCDFNPLTACCSGLGCVRQKLEGQGTAFVQGHGTVMSKTLVHGEKFVLDTRTLLAWEPSARLGVRPASYNPFVCCCWGQGCCNTTLEGPGTIYLQSKTYSQMVDGLAVTVNNKARTDQSA